MQRTSSFAPGAFREPGFTLLPDTVLSPFFFLIIGAAVILVSLSDLYVTLLVVLLCAVLVAWLIRVRKRAGSEGSARDSGPDSANQYLEGRFFGVNMYPAYRPWIGGPAGAVIAGGILLMAIVAVPGGFVFFFLSGLVGLVGLFLHRILRS